MFDGTFQQFFGLVLYRELLNALHVVVGQGSVGDAPDGFMRTRFCAGRIGPIGGAALNANNFVKDVPRPEYENSNADDCRHFVSASEGTRYSCTANSADSTLRRPRVVVT